MKSQKLELIAGAALSLAALMLALPSRAEETSKGTLHIHGEQVTTGCVANMLNSDYELNAVTGTEAIGGGTGDLVTNPDVPTAAHVKISCETPATISAVKLVAAPDLEVQGFSWYAPDSDHGVEIQAQIPVDGWDTTRDDIWKTPLANGGVQVPGEVNVLANGETISIAAHGSYQNFVPVLVFVHRNAPPGDYVMGATYAITY
ncbi:hypothetical protein PI93_013500 [Pandoraea fibrosis]|uniref:Uncharacterized protein n=1 Tax=Pandoraea fibrosis TaxID=1891094 RepID=A0ABX6HSR0_9BURK|nr:hypothetical protein [Pandoraea fibrosis]QHE92899.1 hypothetical protein PJ20_014500 [Pandoraea fibrosis]QHF13544.1 hypothetical protein PI93_013500 [Pandoraea fibrosis]